MQKRFIDRIREADLNLRDEELVEVMGEIPDFTSDDLEELNGLKELLKINPEDDEIKKNIDKLQFYKAADFYRDMANEERFVDFNKSNMLRALKDFLIAEDL